MSFAPPITKKNGLTRKKSNVCATQRDNSTTKSDCQLATNKSFDFKKVLFLF